MAFQKTENNTVVQDVRVTKGRCPSTYPGGRGSSFPCLCLEGKALELFPAETRTNYSLANLIESKQPKEEFKYALLISQLACIFCHSNCTLLG